MCFAPRGGFAPKGNMRFRTKESKLYFALSALFSFFIFAAFLSYFGLISGLTKSIGSSFLFWRKLCLFLFLRKWSLYFCF
jgi:hypothetical protein